MVKDVRKEFSAWLERKFLNWQAENGRRASLQEFADYIGYSRPLISMWLSGKRLPAEDGIERLADLFGLDVYDVLNLPRPNPYLQKINRVFELLSPEHQQKLAEDAERYEATNHNSRRSHKPRETTPDK